MPSAVAATTTYAYPAVSTYFIPTAAAAGW